VWYNLVSLDAPNHEYQEWFMFLCIKKADISVLLKFVVKCYVS